MRRAPLRLFALLTILALTGFGCNSQSQEAINAAKPVTLTWWRVFDDGDSVQGIIDAYRKLHPNVSITYRKLRFEEYEHELVNALAEDRGPDIFSVHNTAMRKYESKLLPLPRELTVPYQVTQGTIKKEVVTQIRKEKTIRTDELKNRFVDQVAQDVILPHRSDDGSVTDRIFGLPLALDTLVLYWNRDLLNAAHIAEPPKTWEEFVQHVKLLTKRDAHDAIIQSGAAIGTISNVERGTDLLSVLMMQNGAVMLRDGSVLFNQIPPDQTRDTPPGVDAARFYTDFSNQGKESYTWNSSMPNSLDAFTAGTTAYFFGYSYDLAAIRARAPKLNFGIAHLPQIDPTNEVNFANYWIEGVSAKTKHPDLAWDFVQFATSAPQVSTYLDSSKKPTAVRSLVSSQLEDTDLAVFASQVLTAKSWYQGLDPDAAERALANMVDSIITGSSKPEEAINIAAGQVSQTLQ